MEVDLHRQRAKNEIESLKTALNLKSLELENVNDDYEEAQKIIASAERKIDDLELTVSILERKLETEREQVRKIRASRNISPYSVSFQLLNRGL